MGSPEGKMITEKNPKGGVIRKGGKSWGSWKKNPTSLGKRRVIIKGVRLISEECHCSNTKKSTVEIGRGNSSGEIRGDSTKVLI